MKLMVRAAVLVMLIGGTASAQRLEFVGKVPVSGTADTVRPAGDPRYIAVSALTYSANAATLDVLDLQQTKVTTVQLSRTMLMNKFGHWDSRLGRSMPPEGELVRYDGNRVGMYLADNVLVLPRRHWYAEIDLATGRLVKSVVVAALDDRQDLHFIGADVGRDAAWFYVERYDSGRNAKGGHTHGQSEVAFRRVDLRSFAVTDEVTVTQPGRRMRSGYEDHMMIHHASDFSHFAIVEYDEADLHITPAPSVYIIDPYAKTSFSVPALDTKYGVAFSRDGKYAYLASARVGTIARVDLAAQKIDKRVAGPALTHHAIVSPNGSKLFVIGSSNKYSVYDLPALDHRTDLAHAPEVAPGAQQLFGGGIGSLDDRFFVMRDAMHKDYSPSHVVVIAKLVD